MRLHLLLLVYFINLPFSFSQQSLNEDSLRVNELNKLGYEIRFTDPEETIKNAEKALKIAEKLNYRNGIAEAYRVMGIGHYYLYRTDVAISKYVTALTIFKEQKNLFGEAKVLNNIGNLYRDVDYDRALKYFDKAQKLAERLNIKDLEAGCYLNKGIIYLKHKKLQEALKFFQKSNELFGKINNPIGITQALQNYGVALYQLGKVGEGEAKLLEANQRAKKADLHDLIGGINLTLADIYISQGALSKAEDALKEGALRAELVKDSKMVQDYMYYTYKLELKRNNYQKALSYLREIYRQDSISFKNLESRKILLLQEHQRILQKQKESELLLEKEKRIQIIFWATLIVLGLSILVIFLLVLNNKKKAKTNQQLKELNQEISRQKENLDKVNQNLEAIIDERTKDLKVKNLKLSEYSSHLSHEVRSPIATLKGLLLLEKEKLIDNDELIREFTVCVNSLDDKIVNINQMLHNPTYKGMHYEHNPTEGPETGESR